MKRSGGAEVGRIWACVRRQIAVARSAPSPLNLRPSIFLFQLPGKLNISTCYPLKKMMRSNITKLAVRRFGSSAVAKDTPREAVARNLLLHKAISEAKTEEQLAKLVAAPLPALTAEGVQQLGLSDYLQRDFAPSVTKFTPDPTAWQNMKGADYVFTEAQRSETWPFLVGLGYVDNVETSC